ncbi:hypothetical protein RPYSC3_18930 [Rhodopseudomonas palustris]|nr:hypothetical protein RPYSC3_18930 [Rhodopseudomonas palustris]
MVAKDPIDPCPIIQWEKPGKPEDAITLPEPYFRAPGYYDIKVYDLEVIRDMLSRLDGDLGEDGHLIKAKRRKSC